MRGVKLRQSLLCHDGSDRLSKMEQQLVSARDNFNSPMLDCKLCPNSHWGENISLKTREPHVVPICILIALISFFHEARSITCYTCGSKKKSQFSAIWCYESFHLLDQVMSVNSNISKNFFSRPYLILSPFVRLNR